MSLLAASRPGPLRGRAGWGLTYVELMITVSVMAILATLIIPTGLRVRRRGHEAELKLALNKIRDAIDEYHQDWELGYIESDSEHGWPETLEQLTEEIEYHGPPPGQQAGAGQPPGGGGGFGSLSGNQANPINALPGATAAEPTMKVYLRVIPQDPFNKYEDEWDTGGWRARSYEDEIDSTSWGGEGVYDVYSNEEWLALDGRSRYSEW